jgi:hypothetical protein
MKSSAKKFQDVGSKRNDSRYHYFSDLSITYEGHGNEIHLHTPDLSPRGLFIHTSMDLPEGAVINVKFRLNRSNYAVSARSEVRYCLPGVGIGVEFIQISPEAQQAIEQELGIPAEVEE